MNRELNALKDALKSNSDVIFKHDVDKNIYLIFQEDLCDYRLFIRDLYPRLNSQSNAIITEVFPGICKELPKDEAFMDKAMQIIFTGLLLCYRDGIFYFFDLSKAPSRVTGDSLAEPEALFDSRDGFVESYKTNIALIRTRVKSANLVIEDFMIGRRSKTYVGVLYIKDIHNPQYLEKIRTILNRIDVDAILSIEDITCYFQRRNIFPTYIYIGSPDLACRKLYEGEYLFIIDRVPTVMAFPTSMNLATRFKIDNVNSKVFTFLERSFVLLALFMSTIFLALVLSFATYQSNSLSLVMVSTINLSQRGVFLPIFLEIFVVLALFELCYLIGFRQSKQTISSTVLLIAGLIIGENLVSSGFVGVVLMTLSALAFLNTFIVSSNVTMLFTISIIRLGLLFSSLFFGIFGISLAVCYLLFRLYEEDPLGVSYFYPLLPLDIKQAYQFFFSSSNVNALYRSKTMHTNDTTKKKKVTK